MHHNNTCHWLAVTMNLSVSSSIIGCIVIVHVPCSQPLCLLNKSGISVYITPRGSHLVNKNTKLLFPFETHSMYRQIVIYFSWVVCSSVEWLCTYFIEWGCIEGHRSCTDLFLHSIAFFMLITYLQAKTLPFKIIDPLWLLKGYSTETRMYVEAI